MIPFDFLLKSIYHTLNDTGYECRLLKSSKEVHHTKLVKKDFLIILQINFLYFHRQNMIIPDLSQYLHGIDKQVILIGSEPIVSRPHLLRQLVHPSVHSIWDYSEQNRRVYDGYPCKSYFVPNGYHPSLEVGSNIQEKDKDIDFLFYGELGGRRKPIFDALVAKGYKVIQGCFDSNNFVRNISRTRVIPIIHTYAADKPVDFYRLSYLLSNRAFVIHEDVSSDYKDTKAMFNEVIYSPYDKLVEDLEHYLIRPKVRIQIANKTHEWWKVNHSLQKYIPQIFS